MYVRMKSLGQRAAAGSQGDPAHRLCEELQAEASWRPARQVGSPQKASEGQRDMAVTTPPYVRIVTHKLPGTEGKTLKVKSGTQITQIIDRCWRFLKERALVNQHTKAGQLSTPSKAQVGPVRVLETTCWPLGRLR